MGHPWKRYTLLFTFPPHVLKTLSLGQAILNSEKNGNLVLCTWDGQVYEIENPTDTDPNDIKITKIADGLCEPLGITEVDGDVYVLQRWELIKPIANDGDGIADE